MENVLIPGGKYLSSPPIDVIDGSKIASIEERIRFNDFVLTMLRSVQDGAMSFDTLADFIISDILKLEKCQTHQAQS